MSITVQHWSLRNSTAHRFCRLISHPVRLSHFRAENRRVQRFRSRPLFPPFCSIPPRKTSAYLLCFQKCLNEKVAHVWASCSTLDSRFRGNDVMPAQAGIQGDGAGCLHTVPLVLAVRRTGFRHEPKRYSAPPEHRLVRMLRRAFARSVHSLGFPSLLPPFSSSTFTFSASLRTVQRHAPHGKASPHRNADRSTSTQSDGLPRQGRMESRAMDAK
jgi:hypothetical protein